MSSDPFDRASWNLPLWIDGGWRRGSETLVVGDPGRPGEEVGSVDLASVADVRDAIDAAQRASGPWAALAIEDRVAELLAALAAVEKPSQGWAEVLTRENGGLLVETRSDIARGLELFADQVQRARAALLPFRASEAVTVHKRPVGVVGCIVPWNSPMVLALGKVGPALVAGNGVVVKPSVEAPLVLTKLLAHLGRLLPAGLLNVVNGDIEVGAELVANPAVRKVSFTGSTEVGKEVLRTAADGIKNVTLELGGNDPAIVLDDADIDASVESLAKAIFTRSGQICFAVKRVYVPREKAGDLETALGALLSEYRVGHGTDERASLGPLINERAKQRVAALAAEARDQGGRVVTFGEALDDQEFEAGAYLLPSLATDLPPDAPLIHREQFGPIVPLIAYDELDHAIEMANASEYGLAASVWTGDEDRARDLAPRLEAGTVFVNCHNVWSLTFEMPFGGVKQSGIGRERGDVGVDAFVELQSVRC